MSLITIDEAAGEFGVHRATLFRAMRAGRLEHHRPLGSRHTLVARDEVQRLVNPARLTEAELQSLVRAVLDGLFEHVESDEGSTGNRLPESLEGRFRAYLLGFLRAYELIPHPTFGNGTRGAVMYESVNRGAETPCLAVQGEAIHARTGELWHFSFTAKLTDELNDIVPGSPCGVASTTLWSP